MSENKEQSKKSSFLSAIAWIIFAVVVFFVARHGLTKAYNFVFAKPLTIGRAFKLLTGAVLFLVVALLILWAAFWGTVTMYVSTQDFVTVPATEEASFLPEIKSIMVDQLTIKHAPRNLLWVISWQIIFLTLCSVLFLLLPFINVGSIFFGTTQFGPLLFLGTLVGIIISPIFYLFALLFNLFFFAAATFQYATPAYWLFMVLITLPISIFINYYGSRVVVFCVGFCMLYIYTPIGLYRWFKNRRRNKLEQEAQVVQEIQEPYGF